jgi:hypothetical protein
VGTPRRIQVTEGKRIDLSAQLEEFHGDAAQSELSFPPTLSNHERAVVHAECRKYGLTSQSQGSGPDRHIVVYKPVKPAEDTSDCAAFPLPLGAAAVAAIQNHFQRFPPSQVRASPLVLPVRAPTHARTLRCVRVYSPRTRTARRPALDAALVLSSPSNPRVFMNSNPPHRRLSSSSPPRAPRSPRSCSPAATAAAVVR